MFSELFFKNVKVLSYWPHRLVVRTRPSQGRNRSPILRGVMRLKKQTALLFFTHMTGEVMFYQQIKQTSHGQRNLQATANILSVTTKYEKMEELYHLLLHSPRSALWKPSVFQRS